jgi:hypothetical protein
MEQTLHERLKLAAGERSYREIATLTATSPETARRYMLGQSPSAEFLSSLCAGTGVNGEWLLTGRGPVHRKEVRAHALREAKVTELLGAMSETLERLIERVERLEVFLQSMEARLRPRPAAGEPKHEPHPASGQRAQSVTDAIARRPPADPD